MGAEGERKIRVLIAKPGLEILQIVGHLATELFYGSRTEQPQGTALVEGVEKAVVCSSRGGWPAWPGRIWWHIECPVTEEQPDYRIAVHCLFE